jgi:hypothetical protein
MAFRLITQVGRTIRNPTLDQMRTELEGMDLSEQEHLRCSVEDERGWNLGYSVDRTVCFENVEDREAKPRHIPNVPVERVLELWMALAEARLDWLETQPWRPGYGS